MTLKLRSQHLNKKGKKLFKYTCFALVAAILSAFLGFQPISALAQFSINTNTLKQAQNNNVVSGESLVEAANIHYENQRYALAADNWTQANERFQLEGKILNQAITLANLTLVYHQLGQWSKAEEAIKLAIELSVDRRFQESLNGKQALAHVLEVSGHHEFISGDASEAYEIWQQAANYHQQIDDFEAITQNSLNQVQALRSLGLHREALRLLQEEVIEQIEDRPDSLTKVVVLRRIGILLQTIGRSYDESEQKLTESLRLAQSLNSQNDVAYAQMTLGNLEQLRNSSSEGNNIALTHYQSAAQSRANIPIRVQAELSQIPIFLNLSQIDIAKQTLNRVKDLLPQLPIGRLRFVCQIKYAEANLHLISLESSPTSNSLRALAEGLAQTIEESHEVGDGVVSSYATGILGSAYLLVDDLTHAEELTREAIAISEAYQSPENTYKWWWQLGKIYLSQSKATDYFRFAPSRLQLLQKSTDAYAQAYDALRNLRKDIIQSNPEFQVEFQENVESTVYREYIDVLFQTYDNSVDNGSSDQEIEELSNAFLGRAREIAHSLQVSEIENYLQEPCAGTNTEALDNLVDQVETKTAVIYPIILENRIEVLLKLPNSKVLQRHKEDNITSVFVAEIIEDFRRNLESEYSYNAVESQGREIYSWLIESFRKDLDQSSIETLVFVSDIALRNVPISTLFDGKDYLIENFAIAQSLSLELTEPSPLNRDNIQILAAGLEVPPEKFRANFRDLPNIRRELETIESLANSDSNQIGVSVIRNFTSDEFNTRINAALFQIVHIATHGIFSSNREESILLTADDNGISIDQLDRLFRARGLNRSDVIELLILTACETASGDSRATLGLAGTAVRAGARSTIASLWSMDDASGADFTSFFYEALLNNPKISKAEALQQAQIRLKAIPKYEHPLYWAPFILVGNWL